MAKRLRKTLPKNLKELLASAADDDAPVRSALEACEPDARGGYGKSTVLGFEGCTPTLARWAVARGTDVNAVDTYGKTALHLAAQAPYSALTVGDLLELGATLEGTCSSGRSALHYAADAQNLPAVQSLLSHGANPNAASKDGQTPLEWSLQRLSNVAFPGMVPVAEALMAAGADRTEAAQEHTRKAAERFEFHRDGYNPDRVDEVAAAAAALCSLLGVVPPARRRTHDGVSPIAATGASWQDQHAELWDLLVPSKGACTTVQGEVIRITGRISDELFRNGGGNWDRDYRAMANALIAHLTSGDPLASEDVAEAKDIAARLLDEMNGSQRLAELAVAWVARNPTPMPLDPPSYGR